MIFRGNKQETPEFARALRESHFMPEQPSCFGREAEFADYSERNIPTKREAEAMCADCPILDVCRASAKTEMPAWGVRGGIAWNFGRQNHRISKRKKNLEKVPPRLDMR